MAIMQSCCCWRSVRRGSFACAVYTAFYFSVIVMTMATFLHGERRYLSGSSSRPESDSLLEPEVSDVTIWFHIALLVCSSCGVVCCLLLLYGLFKEEKLFLVPWICIMIVCSFVDITHLIYLSSVSFDFNPRTAMLLVLDFFLFCVNAYSVLCVISQYQEYAAGRGTASDDCDHRMISTRSSLGTATTATSCLSSKRTLVSNNTTATPTQSPTAALSVDMPPDRFSNSSRKHVQFPAATDEAFGTESRMVTKFNVLEDESSENSPWLNDF